VWDSRTWEVCTPTQLCYPRAAPPCLRCRPPRGMHLQNMVMTCTGAVSQLLQLDIRSSGRLARLCSHNTCPAPSSLTCAIPNPHNTMAQPRQIPCAMRPCRPLNTCHVLFTGVEKPGQQVEADGSTPNLGCIVSGWTLSHHFEDKNKTGGYTRRCGHGHQRRKGR
jgi:hypothetical protein